VRIRGRDAFDLGAVRRLPIAGIAGDHAVRIEEMQVPPGALPPAPQCH
jgi:hypothetical protein